MSAQVWRILNPGTHTIWTIQFISMLCLSACLSLSRSYVMMRGISVKRWRFPNMGCMFLLFDTGRAALTLVDFDFHWDFPLGVGHIKGEFINKSTAGNPF